MGKIISFANQKGGVGKTTSAVNIASSLGVLGYKTLLVDLDPQGNATSGVGIAKKSLKYTIKDVLMNEIPVKEAIITTEFKNLSLIPSNMSLAGTEFDLLQEDTAEPWAAMRTAFSVIKEEYDYIIIDTAPVGPVADTLIIAPFADATIYVCRANYTAKDDLQLLNHMYAESTLKNVSIVLNGVDMTKRKYGYYYGYGSYSRYGKYRHGQYGQYGYGPEISIKS